MKARLFLWKHKNRAEDASRPPMGETAPTPLILLPSLKTGLLIHVLVSVALMTHQIFSIMSVIAFMLGLRKIHAEIIALILT